MNTFFTQRMMPSTLFHTMGLAGPSPVSISPDVAEELSRYPASSSLRRHSKGSASGRRPMNSMRVQKPSSSSSASNSPRHALFRSRRRTVVIDGLHHATSDPSTWCSRNMPSVDCETSPVLRSSRPFSWHPDSFAAPPMHLATPQQTMCPNVGSTYSGISQSSINSYMQFPPTPSQCSKYPSPCGFSPLSLPAADLTQPPYHSSDAWPTLTVCQLPPAYSPASRAFSPTNSPMQNQLDLQYSYFDTVSAWNNFLAYGFNQNAIPPTPQNRPELAQQQQPQQQHYPNLAPEEYIPYQPLEGGGNVDATHKTPEASHTDIKDDEPEGEVFYGMGLYDAPEKPEANERWTSLSESPSPDPSEAMGKGLKLEDPWEPPAEGVSNEEEDDDDETEYDGSA